MNSIGLVFFVLVGTLFTKVNAEKPTSYEGFRVYEVIAHGENDVRLRQPDRGLSVLKENHIYIKERQYVVRSYLVSEQLEESFRRALDKADVVYNVAISNVGKLIEQEKADLESRRSPDNGIHSKIYLSYEEGITPSSDETEQDPVIINLQMLEYFTYICKIKNPENGQLLAVAENIGNSYEGRNIFGLTISSDHQREKPIILFEAGIHAREWTSPASALYIISQLVENYTKNADILRDIDFYVIPLSNPDGYEYSRTKDRLWRKTRSVHVEGYCGVDANRNFDFHWGETGSSSDPLSDIYKGPYAFSEAESRNIRDTVKKHKDRVRAYISIHAYGPSILYPWGYSKSVEAPESPLMKHVASKAAEVMKNFGGSDYLYGQSSVLLYESAGGTDDYFKGVFNVALTYTFELSSHGSESFIVDPQKVHSIVSEAFEGYKVIAKYAANYGMKRKINQNGFSFWSLS